MYSVKLQDLKSIHRNQFLLYALAVKILKNEENYPFTITGNTIRYLRINLIKEVKDLDNEKCKTLLKEIEEENK